MDTMVYTGREMCTSCQGNGERLSHEPLKCLPDGATSSTLRSYLPPTPQRYRELEPQSHWTVAMAVAAPAPRPSSPSPPPSPSAPRPAPVASTSTSTTVPTWPSPPSWSPQLQSGPRTTRRPASSSIFPRGGSWVRGISRPRWRNADTRGG